MTAEVEGTMASIREGMTALAEGIPDVMQAFGAVGKAVYRDGALPTKTKEMLAIASAIATHCEGCIVWHTRGAVRQGMTRAELQDVIAVAVHMGGGPSLVYGIKALEAFDQMTAEQDRK